MRSSACRHPHPGVSTAFHQERTRRRLDGRAVCAHLRELLGGGKMLFQKQPLQRISKLHGVSVPRASDSGSTPADSAGCCVARMLRGPDGEMAGIFATRRHLRVAWQRVGENALYFDTAEQAAPHASSTALSQQRRGQRRIHPAHELLRRVSGPPHEQFIRLRARNGPCRVARGFAGEPRT